MTAHPSQLTLKQWWELAFESLPDATDDELRKLAAVAFPGRYSRSVRDPRWMRYQYRYRVGFWRHRVRA